MLKTPVLTALIIVLIGFPSRTNDHIVLTFFRGINPETAQKFAQATLDVSRVKGYQVSVTIPDRFGDIQVTPRNRFADGHTPETAQSKAWRIVSPKTDTETLSDETKPGLAVSGA